MRLIHWEAHSGHTAIAMAYGLDKKLVGMITDNASNMAKAFKSMTIKPHLHDKTCCQTGCQTHLTTG